MVSVGKTSLVLRKGNYFGDLSLLSNIPQKFQVKSLEHIKLLVIDQNTFREILQPLLYKLDDLVKDFIIGVGGFAIVYKVYMENSPETTFALKKISKSKFHSESSLKSLKNEKLLLLKVSNPFIVKLITTFQDESFVYLLQDYVEAGDLRTLLISQDPPQFPEETAKFYSAIIVEVLEALHSKNIVYRDLKPENLLLCSNGYIKLCDFGNAKSVIDRTYSHVGTPDYMPPEICLDQGHGVASDYWTYGVVVYEFLQGETPFEAKPGMDHVMRCDYK